jgi:hypothetical protein
MTEKTKARLPRYKKAKTPPSMRLTDRDKRIVEAVYQLRFLTRDQIRKLEFDKGSMTACQRRLSLLFHNGYLSAVHKPIPTGYGSSKRVYCLSKKGAALIAHLYGEKEARKIKWNEKQNKVETFFIEHTLAINDVRIAFFKEVLEDKAYELSWSDEKEVKAWKEKVDDPDNQGKTLPVTPDSFLSLTGNKKKANYFLEVDRATESNRRWKNKVRGYVEYVLSGKYYEKFKSEALRIITVTTTQERLNNLLKTTKSVNHADFFLFTTFGQIKDNNVLFGNIWKDPATNSLTRLVKF